MSEPMYSSYAFLPWARLGLASLISSSSTLDKSRIQLRITLTLEGATPGNLDLSLMGPGDVTGFDKNLVIRTDPVSGSRDFEPNYLPSLEFDRPDFPWLFSPVAPTDSSPDRIMPWLCLIVVEKSAVDLEESGLTPTPVLKIQGTDIPLLPSLSQLWAWAHVQISAYSQGEVLADIFRDAPERLSSRLICPQQLKARTTYYACVVPTYEVGRLAGLGETPTGDEGLTLAWDTNEPGTDTLELPVYYHLEFSSGQAGDFESLARRLTPGVLVDEIGTRTLDITNPGYGITPLDAGHAMAVVKRMGALRGPDTAVQAVINPDEHYEAYQSALVELINSGADFGTNVVAPPIYGRLHAAVKRLEDAEDLEQITWINELNVLPWLRSAAAAGSRVVEANQRALMAAAWDQADEVVAANQAKRQAQLAARATASTHRKWFSRLSPSRLLQVTGPAHARIPLETESGQPNVLTRLKGTRLKTLGSSSAFRRMTRPRGGPAARFGSQSGGEQSLPTGFKDLISNFANQEPNREPFFPNGGAYLESEDFDTVSNVGDFRELFNSATLSGISVSGNVTWDTDTHWMTDDGSGMPADTRPTISKGAFKTTSVPHFAQIEQLDDLHLFVPDPELLDETQLEAIHSALLDGLNPGGRLLTRVLNRLELPASSATKPFSRTLIGPTFPQPMYEALRAVEPDLILAGANTIPANTVGLLQTNRQFIEAFMVGLNHAMSGELLWNSYPANVRATYFTQFWDVSEVEGESPDIPAINSWTALSLLGEHVPSTEGPESEDSSPPGDTLVLLIRGELLRRYPRAVIYAAEAVAGSRLSRQPSSEAEDHIYPTFRATFGEDITCLGFPLTQTQATSGGDSSLGYFFVLEEQPTEPRFGLEAQTDSAYGPTSLDSWNELTWGNLVNSAEELEALAWIDIDAPNPNSGGTVGDSPATWGQNAAHMAQITLQLPVRVAIHATDMLPSS